MAAGAFLLRFACHRVFVQPRPLSRSITFWSGVLVMLFLAWSWWDSFRNYSVARVGSVIEIASLEGEVEFGNADWFEPWDGHREKLAKKMPAKIFPRPVFLRGHDDILDDQAEFQRWSEEMAAAPDQVTRAQLRMRTYPRDHVKLMVPHWLLLLAAAPPWFGLLFWRASRHRKARQGLSRLDDEHVSQ